MSLTPFGDSRYKLLKEPSLLDDIALFAAYTVMMIFSLRGRKIQDIFWPARKDNVFLSSN